MTLKFCDWQTVSPFFSPAEVLSPEILASKPAWSMIDLDALALLNAFRAHVSTPLKCNFGNLHLRGVRSLGEQIRVQKLYGGADNSQHVAGRAFDLSSDTLTVEQLADAAIAFGWSAVGVYVSKGFVHVDRRVLFSNNQIVFRK